MSTRLAAGVTGWRISSGCALAVASMGRSSLHLFLGRDDAPLDEEDDENHEEEDHGNRRGIAHREVAEALLIDEIRERRRRFRGSAARHDEDLVEDLEGADDAQRQHE